LNRIKKTCRLLLCHLCSNNIFLCILCCLNEIGNTGLVTIQRTRLIIFSLWKRSIVLSFAFFYVVAHYMWRHIRHHQCLVDILPSLYQSMRES
jgi:hypothetical protein